MRTLWNAGRLAIMLTMWVCICQTVGAHQENNERDSVSSPSAACATPASSRSEKGTKSVPFKRPSFHPPKLKSENDGGPSIDFQSNQFESEIGQSIIQETQPSDMPKLNPLKIDDAPQNSNREETGPQLNTPGNMSNPVSLPSLPEVAPDISASELPTPGPAPVTNNGPPMNVGQYDDLDGVEFNLSDAGCSPIMSGTTICRPGSGRPLVPLRRRTWPRERAEFDQQEAESLWSDCGQQCNQRGEYPAISIGENSVVMGAGIAKKNNRSESTLPGMLPV